jgi:hypothetical protein
MHIRNAVIVFRLVLAALSLTGVVVQFVIAVQANFGIVNFFSYFTNLTNILASTVFIVSAVHLARGYETNDRDVAIRGGSVVYMVFVGIVFNTLLVGADLGELQPWVNVVHHMVMPLAVLVDWVVWPPLTRIARKTALVWTIFPAAYVVYSLIRGAITGFYAYPFFNPVANGGYGGVALYCGVMLLAFVVLALLVRWLANARVQAAARVHALRV